MIQFGFLISLLIVLSCELAAQHPDAISPRTGKFCTGDDPARARSHFADTAWTDQVLGKVWQEQGYPDYHGYAWYRIHMVIPVSLRSNALWGDSLRIFLAHVNDVDETWLNGVRIGKTGFFPDDPGGYVSKWPAVREYHLAAGDPAIQWGGENVLAIKVYDGGGTGGIFMGSPYIDMLERSDGLVITVPGDSIRYGKELSEVPLLLKNRFNTPVSGLLHIRIGRIASNRPWKNQRIAIHIAPFGEKAFRWSLPNEPGIELSYSFFEMDPKSQEAPGGIDKIFAKAVAKTVALPYTLTPPPSPLPAIHNASVIGTHPGAPFLLKIAATGKRPLTFAAERLPAGLQLDQATGSIRGVIDREGNYPISITASNELGSVKRILHIRVGAALALTPPMGWNSWNCWGINISEEKIRSSAQAMVDKGLADYGWCYINIDDGWEAPHRGEDSSIRANGHFGDMAALGNWLHDHGLKFGIYSSPGPRTCGGFLGSYGYEERDAATYAAWGIDYLKYDWCSYDGIAGNDSSSAMYRKPYEVMAEALSKQKRDIVYSLCQYGMNDVWRWAPMVNGQSWRTTGDIEDSWQSLSRIGFGQSKLYPYAGPGHWNDPDMMIVGQVGWGENLHPSRLTPDEQYTHVSLWCMLSAPLLIGCDISKLDAFTLNLLTNAEVLAIDQDELGRQARPLLSRDSCQFWIKELSDGGKAMAVFNLSGSFRQIRAVWKELGLSGRQKIRDCWRQKDLGTVTNGWSLQVPAHGVMLIKLEPGNKKLGSP